MNYLRISALGRQKIEFGRVGRSQYIRQLTVLIDTHWELQYLVLEVTKQHAISLAKQSQPGEAGVVDSPC